MAPLTRLTGWTQCVCIDGVFIAMQRHVDDVLEIACLAGDPCGDEAAPNMAFHTVNSRMWRNPIRCVLGRHGVAARSTERGRVGVIPGICSTNQDCQG